MSKLDVSVIGEDRHGEEKGQGDFVTCCLWLAPVRPVRELLTHK